MDRNCGTTTLRRWTLEAIQSRMARAALQLGMRDAAKAAKVSANTIIRLEGGEDLKERTVEDIRRAYETAGAKFVDDGEWIGVMVKRE
jgi:DNA-binding XRE family transcriptional regulator